MVCSPVFLRGWRWWVQKRLTARERDVARLIAKGSTYKEIASALGNAPATVRNQIQTIYSKLQVSNIAELVRVMLDDF